jgi:RimJ/RimL family protein N-acetyltransferase
MSEYKNKMGQPIGEPVKFDGATYPTEVTLQGQYVKCVPLNIKAHSKALFNNYALDQTGTNWTYLFDGPFERFEDWQTWLEKTCTGSDPFFYCFLDARSDEPIGMGAYLRITPNAGSIEVGHLSFSPKMQGTRMSTEAMFLMMKEAFKLGYRRYEWKCNALNEPSCKAALRLGFQFEGIFRQALVVKGHNRDTAWFSIIDKEWSALEQRFQAWLDPQNFDIQGNQIKRLGEC